MTEKTPNYTEEMEAVLRDMYDPEADEETRDAQVAQIADEVGRSAASVRAKLTNMKLYVPKAKAPAGKNTVRKADLVAEIASKLGADEDVLGSLEKANKNALSLVLKALP
jgi:hypothetical protein